jgi:GNAT superfamily N-acetyltransferase
MPRKRPVRSASGLKPKAQIHKVRIRPAAPGDRAWLISLSARLHEFGPPAWRSRQSMDRAEARYLEQALREPTPNVLILVAEDAHGEPLGFVYLHTATDYFTREIHSHVSDLVVVSAAEGLGVGTALLRAAEAWAVKRHHRLLTLNVFMANQRARALYERAGFLPDTIMLVKELRPRGRRRP